MSRLTRFLIFAMSPAVYGIHLHRLRYQRVSQTAVSADAFVLCFEPSQTITRLGEKTIFRVGEGPRTIDLGSGQFLLYAPKKAGGAKVKAGPVTAAITG
jgi:hypothetical protein